MSEVQCPVCQRIVAPAQFSERLSMCHECRADELVVQMATMSATFTAWAEAFNAWTKSGDEARATAEEANRAAAPLMMALREHLGIEDTDPREEHA